MKRLLTFSILCMGLIAAACTTDDSGEVTMEWVEGLSPPATVTAGQAFTVQWTIKGGNNIPHTNLHSCPAAEPDCRAPSETDPAGTRVDGEVKQRLAGADETAPFQNDYVLPPGEWIVKLHASVVETEGAEPKNHFLPIPGNGTVISSGVMITTNPATLDVTNGTEFTITVAAGPTDATEVNASACADGEADCATNGIAGNSTNNGDGTWTVAFTLPDAGDYDITATAMVAGEAATPHVISVTAN